RQTREALHQIGHLDRRDSSVISSIDSSYCGACVCLLFGLGGQHAEDDRQAIVIGHPRNPAADLGADVLEVRRLSADHGTETDDGVISTGTRQSGRDQGNLERPGDEHLVDRLVTGSEIPLVASRLARSRRYDAIICLGAVIRGETPHFEHISAEVSRGIARVSYDYGMPVIFGVLTTDTAEQADARSGGGGENRGYDAG